MMPSEQPSDDAAETPADRAAFPRAGGLQPASSGDAGDLSRPGGFFETASASRPEPDDAHPDDMPMDGMQTEDGAAGSEPIPDDSFTEGELAALLQAFPELSDPALKGAVAPTIAGVDMGRSSHDQEIDGEDRQPVQAPGDSGEEDESETSLDDGDADVIRALEQGCLPDAPPELLAVIDWIEHALRRRLRNLSHAINVELLRCGISPYLLPASLLEAVLQGQLESQPAPSNLVRLQLPFGLKPGAPPLQAQAVLLRVVDLEMEEARLRTCRRRLQQHRQELRRMAQQYRRLQRRHQAHEAQRLWLQDIRRSRSTPT